VRTRMSHRMSPVRGQTLDVGKRASLGLCMRSIGIAEGLEGKRIELLIGIVLNVSRPSERAIMTYRLPGSGCGRRPPHSLLVSVV
jgi:hypothetical protein